MENRLGLVLFRGFASDQLVGFFLQFSAGNEEGGLEGFFLVLLAQALPVGNHGEVVVAPHDQAYPGLGRVDFLLEVQPGPRPDVGHGPGAVMEAVRGLLLFGRAFLYGAVFREVEIEHVQAGKGEPPARHRQLAGKPVLENRDRLGMPELEVDFQPAPGRHVGKQDLSRLEVFPYHGGLVQFDRPARGIEGRQTVLADGFGIPRHLNGTVGHPVAGQDLHLLVHDHGARRHADLAGVQKGLLHEEFVEDVIRAVAGPLFRLSRGDVLGLQQHRYGAGSHAAASEPRPAGRPGRSSGSFALALS